MDLELGSISLLSTHNAGFQRGGLIDPIVGRPPEYCLNISSIWRGVRSSFNAVGRCLDALGLLLIAGLAMFIQVNKDYAVVLRVR